MFYINWLCFFNKKIMNKLRSWHEKCLKIIKKKALRQINIIDQIVTGGINNIFTKE